MSADWQTVSGLDPFSVPLTVLHVAQPVDGGVAGYVRSVAAFQASHGWDVTVAGGFEVDNPVRTVPWHARRSPVRGVAAEVDALGQVLALSRPDVVVLHSAKAGLVGRLAIRSRIPTVYLPHAWSFYALPSAAAPAARAWERLAARWTSAVVAVSGAEAEDGVRAGIAAPMFVVPNPAPSVAPGSRPSPQHARASLGLPDVPTAVCVGRLSRQKGQDLLLRAWPTVTARVPDAHLVLVGDGPWRDRLECGAPPSVSFVGGTGDPLAYLDASDVVVLPSRWEGMSLAMLEGMAVGRPVVMTRVGGAEVVEECGCGRVVPLERVDRLADAVAARLEQVERSAQEGRAAADYVRRHHTEEGSFRLLTAVVLRAYAFGRTVR